MRSHKATGSDGLAAQILKIAAPTISLPLSKAKKDRGTGFSVLAAREMKQEPKKTLPALLLGSFFARSLTLVPRSLLLNRTETLATQATRHAKEGHCWRV